MIAIELFYARKKCQLKVLTIVCGINVVLHSKARPCDPNVILPITLTLILTLSLPLPLP